MECYACTNEPSRQCSRCARVYCELHGGDLCGECQNPASSLPSFNLYRGSLLALLIGSAVALWLIIQPPGSSNGRDLINIAAVTPTAGVTAVNTPKATSQPTAANNTPAAPTAGTAAPAGTPQPTATAAPRQYTVQDGDALLSIAEQFAPPGVDAATYAQQIANASGMSSVDEPIRAGQTLTLP